MDEGCSKSHNDVKEEEDINHARQQLVSDIVGEERRETDIDRDHYAVERRESHHEQVPASFVDVVDADHVAGPLNFFQVFLEVLLIMLSL